MKSKFLTLMLSLLFLTGCSVQKSIIKTEVMQPVILEKAIKPSGNFIIAGFYPYWEQSHFPPAVAIDKNLNILYHAFVWPDSAGNIVIPRKFDNKQIVDVAKNYNVKVLLSMGGSNASSNLSKVLANKETFQNFVNNLVNFIKTNKYNGIDIDWEFPNTSIDTLNLNNFVEAIRQELGQNYLISIDLPNNKYFGKYFDINFLKNYVNYFVIMTYDYAGAWSKISGYNAPLKSGMCNSHDVENSVEYWLMRGLSSSKVLLGIPFYGRVFNANEPCQEFTKSYAASYRNIFSLLKNDQYQYFWDFMTKTPYLINKKDKIYYSFDDLNSISDKIRFAFEMNLGGVAIWEITQDIIDDKHALLSQIAQIVQDNST